MSEKSSRARFRSALGGRDAHIRSLRVGLAMMTSVALFCAYGWLQAGKDFTVHNPPDFSVGSTRPWWEVPKPNVYDFAVNLFGMVNRWQNDGSQDYAKNLHRYYYYLTPQCHKVLQQDERNKREGRELSGRSRSLTPIPGYGFEDWRVTVHSKDSWTVLADFELKEYVGDSLVKHNYTRWPLRVVRYDVDTEQNPWGLAIDCFDGPAKEIQFTSTKESKS